MSDSVKKYYEMKEDGEFDNVEWARYIWVLDFSRGKVYRYDIRSKKTWGWNPDSEACEEFLSEMGHSIGNIEWMVCAESEVTY